MPITPGTYFIKVGEEFQNATEKPYILTKGEGKQLIVSPLSGGLNQQWRIELPLGAEKDSKDRIIRPHSELSEILAVSQDAVQSPNEISLIKNFQIWSFEPVAGDTTQKFKFYEIRSNFYAGHGLSGSDPLLSVDKETKKVVIQFSPVIPDVPIKRPFWAVMGPLD